MTELEHAEKRMGQKWYDLVMAEQQGASQQVLERMYNAYVLAVEVYNRCSEQSKQTRQEESLPVVPTTAKRTRRKAS
jgi:hypothetical protein